MVEPLAGQFGRDRCRQIFFLVHACRRPFRRCEIGLSWRDFIRCLGVNRIMRRLTGLIAVLFIALFFAGCSGIDDPTKNWSPEKLYKEAKDRVADGDYETGIKYFESLEARYPYGRYSEQAQLEIAYAYYKY